MITNKWFMGKDYGQALDIRRAVFVEEQGFDAEQEKDAFDDAAMHLVLYDDGTPVATGRILYDGSRFMIGRVCVLAKYRGQEIGDLLTRLLLWKVFFYTKTVWVCSQMQAAPFYERYGFVREGPRGRPGPPACAYAP